MHWAAQLKNPEYSRYSHIIPIKDAFECSKRIVLISDTHISSGINSSFNGVMFRKGLEEISKLKNIDYIIHLGDLTHDGTYMEYQIALDMIRKINNENFYIIPGNHDSRNVGHLLFEELLGARTFEIDDPHLFILGLDSSIPDQNAGRISFPAIARAEKSFLDHQDQIKIFCFHHQLIPIPFTGRERSAIFDAGDVLDMALKTNVDIVLNGHRHITNSYSCSDGDTDMVIFNSGTLSANKTRYRELFTYTILDINNSTVNFITKKLMDDTFLERSRPIRHFFEPYQAINQKAAGRVPSCQEDSTESSIRPKIRLIHAGNTHFGDKLFLPEVYDLAAAQINELCPDLFMQTGSVTSNNLPREFDLAAEKLALLECPQLILPGFKDLTKYGWDRFKSYFKTENPRFSNDKLRVIGLNTVDPHLSNGAVGRKRMADICNEFRGASHDKFNVIAMNHRLIPSPKLKFEEILEDSGSVLKNFTEPRNQIDLIVMGKNNIGFSLQLEETILSFCGAMSSVQSVEMAHHCFNVVDVYPNGYVRVFEHSIEQDNSIMLGQYWQ